MIPAMQSQRNNEEAMEEEDEALEIEDAEQIDFAPDPDPGEVEAEVTSVSSSTVVSSPFHDDGLSNRQKRLLEEPPQQQQDNNDGGEDTQSTDRSVNLLEDTQKTNRSVNLLEDTQKTNRSVNLLETSSESEDDSSISKYVPRSKRNKQQNHPPGEISTHPQRQDCRPQQVVNDTQGAAGDTQALMDKADRLLQMYMNRST
jgi:hypothetical protein